MPGAWYVQAQRFRQWYRDRLREVFQHIDIILAPVPASLLNLANKQCCWTAKKYSCVPVLPVAAQIEATQITVCRWDEPLQTVTEAF
ncbi:MAG: hypothetical protein KME43_08875 [Myxacorys chilensis ATA2-1-KO14]|nr:hypothetical protein [Myxacorys chilensis ATA2-1-KO14]